jgi:hypothetical protein
MSSPSRHNAALLRLEKTSQEKMGGKGQMCPMGRKFICFDRQEDEKTAPVGIVESG